jgi:hypothetical protein
VNSLLVVADKDGNVKAAALKDPDNVYSPVAIETVSSNGEEMYEVAVPEEMGGNGLGAIMDYYLETGGKPRLVKRST